ncbi:MAG: SnoaL-like domain-containing protein [Chitinophagales bacterium]
MSTQKQSMSTQEVADRLVSLCRQGKVLEAGQELYADNIVSIEPENSPMPAKLSGKPAVTGKGKQFAEMIEAQHAGKISDPLVAGNHFTISWWMDVTMKGQGRTSMDEVIVYEVKDGKIVREQFYY